MHFREKHPRNALRKLVLVMIENIRICSEGAQMYYLIKIAVTAVLVVLIAEISKRSSFWGAVLASVPLVSVLAMVWIYIDTKDVAKISALSGSVFWLVIPSLPFFLILPMLLERGIGFYAAMLISLGICVGCYWGMVTGLGHYGIKL